MVYRDHGGWGFQSKNTMQTPGSHFLFNRLAVLVRHSQAQKYLQINLKPFQQAAMKLLKFPFN